MPFTLIRWIRTNAVRAVLHEPPRRVLAPLPFSPVSVSDYLFPGEGPADSLASLADLLDLGALLEGDVQVRNLSIWSTFFATACSFVFIKFGVLPSTRFLNASLLILLGLIGLLGSRSGGQRGCTRAREYLARYVNSVEASRYCREF